MLDLRDASGLVLDHTGQKPVCVLVVADAEAATDQQLEAFATEQLAYMRAEGLSREGERHIDGHCIIRQDGQAVIGYTSSGA